MKTKEEILKMSKKELNNYKWHEYLIGVLDSSDQQFTNPKTGETIMIQTEDGEDLIWFNKDKQIIMRLNVQFSKEEYFSKLESLKENRVDKRRI